MSKELTFLYLPHSDKDALVVARECLPAGKAVAKRDNILRFALFEGKNHKIASVVRLYDRPLKFMNPQIIGKKAIPSRGLCQILILASAEKNSLSFLHRILKKKYSWLYMANNTGRLPCCCPRTRDGVKTNFLQLHPI